MKRLLPAFMAVIFLALCAPLPATAGEAVTYYDGETELEGYWAAPSNCADETGKAPVVMIIHQWKGLTDYEKGRADQLSSHCYNAFAIDIYGKGVRPETAAQAGKQAGIYKNNYDKAIQRMNAALAFAKNKAGNDVPVAAIGYCFGGTMVLELARSGANLAGVVSFHGGLSTDHPASGPGIITASIQVHHGADDPHVTQQELDAFIVEMDNAEADWMLTQYAGAVHAFTQKSVGDDPAKGAAYNSKADKRSWAAMLDFLDGIFAPAG